MPLEMLRHFALCILCVCVFFLSPWKMVKISWSVSIWLRKRFSSRIINTVKSVQFLCAQCKTFEMKNTIQIYPSVCDAKAKKRKKKKHLNLTFITMNEISEWFLHFRLLRNLNNVPCWTCIFFCCLLLYQNFVHLHLQFAMATCVFYPSPSHSILRNERKFSRNFHRIYINTWAVQQHLLVTNGHMAFLSLNSVLCVCMCVCMHSIWFSSVFAQNFSLLLLPKIVGHTKLTNEIYINSTFLI